MPTVRCGFDRYPDMLASIGPTLPVQVGLDLAYEPGGAIRPQLAPDQFPALIDTGAEASCIDAELADTLRLPTVDHQVIAGIHGAAPLNRHLAQMYIPGLDFTMNGRFAGVHLASGGLPYFAIIGRDMLRHLVMIYDGPTGNVSLEHNPPSSHAV